MAKTITPHLKPNAKIGVMAPSSYVEKEDIEKSKAELEKRGYEVFIHPQTYEREHQSAGSPFQKRMALQGLWQRDDIDAIWFARGGNGAGAMLEGLNYDKFTENPKPVIGFSDNTALLNAITAKSGITTYHGPVFAQLHKHADLDTALSMLEGKTTTYEFKDITILKEGSAKGRLIGGNLSVFQSLIGTPYLPDLQGAILYLEDCGDHTSRIARMFMHLRNAGIHNQISALLIGQFTDLEEGTTPYGYSMHEIIQNFTEKQGIPCITGLKFGHNGYLPTFPNGLDTELFTHTDKTLHINFL